jgi:general secretion pathway protein G
MSSLTLSSSAPFAPSSFRGNSAKKAFTLLEILVALAILGLLAGLAISSVGNVLGGANPKVAKIFVNDTMKTALTTYRIQVGDYPSTAEGLQALIVAPADKVDRWHGPYIDVDGGKIPQDPWSHDYKYAYPGTHNKDGYDLWSLGKSGVDGGPDNIGNW